MYLCFLGLTFLITIVPLNNFSIITMIIMIMPYFVPCCVTNQSGTYCKEKESSLTALSHISSVLKWSGTPQLPWVYLNCFNRHFLGLKVIRNNKKCALPHDISPVSYTDPGHTPWCMACGPLPECTLFVF